MTSRHPFTDSIEGKHAGFSFVPVKLIMVFPFHRPCISLCIKNRQPFECCSSAIFSWLLLAVSSVTSPILGIGINPKLGTVTSMPQPKYPCHDVVTACRDLAVFAGSKPIVTLHRDMTGSRQGTTLVHSPCAFGASSLNVKPSADSAAWVSVLRGFGGRVPDKMS